MAGGLEAYSAPSFRRHTPSYREPSPIEWTMKDQLTLPGTDATRSPESNAEIIRDGVRRGHILLCVAKVEIAALDEMFEKVIVAAE